jgi:molybdopterin molybdotransferase
MTPDAVIVVDWAGGDDTGPRARRDAIWIGATDSAGDAAPRYFRNRDAACDWLATALRARIGRGQRVLAGFDFPFATPSGLARHLTGSDDPLAFWDWLAARIADGARGGNRFDIAAAINAACPGEGPFWFNGLGRDIPGLPRRRPPRDWSASPWPERRLTESRAPGAFTLWQMGGAGAVGSQALTGMARLSRLRSALGPAVAVWPFEPACTALVVLAEVWPSLANAAVRATADPIRDRAQVRVLARALWRMGQAGTLAAALAVPSAEPRAATEGWILGVGAEAALRAAAA